MSIPDIRLQDIATPELNYESGPQPSAGLTPIHTSLGNQDICVACLEFSAVIETSYHRHHNTIGLRVVGTDLEQYRNGTSHGLQFDWSLLIWHCLSCSTRWSSYVFFSGVHDGRFADPVDSPELLIRRRSLRAQSAQQFTGYGSFNGLDTTAVPDCVSQVTENLSTSYTQPTGHSQDVPQAGNLWHQSLNFMTSPSPIADALFPENAFLDSPQGSSWMSDPIHRTVSQPNSAPDSSYYQSQKDIDQARRARASSQSPVANRHPRTRPSASKYRLSTYHSRGPNFDIDNYAEVRKRGACEDCRARKKQCTPAHRTQR